MDIRSFFHAKGGATKPDTTPAKKKETPIKKTPQIESPSRRTPPRRAAKRQIVVVDDSEDEEEGDLELLKQPTTRKRLRVRPNELDESDDDAVVAPKKPIVSKSKVLMKPKEELVVKKEVVPELKEEEEDTSTPIQVKSTGRPPSPYPGCLDGKTFVFTGVLLHTTREEMIHLVKKCGGSIATSISRNTTYLVIGEVLENGDDVVTSKKYKEAIEKHIRILRQHEFYNLISDLAANKERQEKKKPLKTSPSIPSNTSNHLWTDKYKPTCLNDMIGNIELGKKLMQWLMDWDAIHIKHTKKVAFTTKLSDNRGAKTVLLSGPPGIGKTTIATLVAHLCGFECTELNASDTRSKKMLQSGLKDVLGTQAIQFQHQQHTDKMQLAKRVIIMDEVDGMSGGDRGGTAELIQLIKTSKTPIICICNDRQSTKVKSLANHSYDLRMRRPTKQQISKRLMDIGQQEGLQIEKNAIEEAADRCGNDIRQLLTQMQRWRLTTTSITYNDMIQPTSQHHKDESLRLNPFSATQHIFQRDLTFEARNEAYFVDYDMMPLMIQENYISSLLHVREVSMDEKLQAAAHAAEWIAQSDVVNTYVRMDQRWDLLTTQAAFNVAACIHSAGFIGHPEFSRWLGKNSTANKSKRLLSELSVRMRAHASGSRQVIRMDYIPCMKEILLTKLLSGEDQVQEVIELLDSCEITREDLTESMESFKLSGIKRHSYSELETKAKTAFTRLYNKATHKSQGVVERDLLTTTVKKGRGRAIVEDDDSGLPPPSDAESEGEIQDDDDVDISKFQKKPRGRASTGDDKGKRKATPRKTPTKKRKSD